MSASNSLDRPLRPPQVSDSGTNDPADSAPSAAERLRLVLDTAYDAYVAIDEAGIITDWNVQAELTFGWSKTEAIGQTLVERIIPMRFRTAHLAGLERFLSTGEGRVLDRRLELAACHRDGHEFPIELSIRALRTNGIYTFNAFIRDIREQKRWEETLRERERQLSEAQILARLGSWSWEIETDVASWSHELFEIFGVDPQTTISYGFYLDQIHPDDRDFVDSSIQRSLVTGDPFSVDHRIRLPDGSIRWLHCRGEVKTRDGTPVGMLGVAQDITERKNMEGLRSLLASIVESSDEALISLTTDGTIQTWNPGAEHLYGYTRKEIVGRSLATLIPTGRSRELTRIIDTVIRGNRVDRHETQRRRKDGSVLDVSVTVSPIRDEAGNVIGASSVARDITELKRAEHARQRALDKEQQMVRELRQLDSIRRDFISNVSHELRTPLTSITGYSDILSEETLGAINEDQRSALEVIGRSSRRLLSLIENILTLSKIESGLFDVNPTPTELAPVIEDACHAMAPTAETRSIELVVDVASDLGVVAADAVQLDRALLNLLSNALKFTPDGGRVSVRAMRAGAHIVITVTDTGIGIEPAEQDRLFSRFFRASTATEHAIQGTGLGLVIAKSIIEAHLGTIRVDSEPGHGTTVTIALPARNVAEKNRAH